MNVSLAANEAVEYELCLQIVEGNAGRFARAYSWLEPDDLVQEGWLAIMRCKEGYSPDLGPFDKYASTAVFHALIRFMDRFRKHALPSLDEPIDEEGGRTVGELLAETPAAEAEIDYERLIEALRCLKPDELEAVRAICGFDGKPVSDAELGQRLGLTRQGANVRFQRAIRKLRKRMGVVTRSAVSSYEERMDLVRALNPGQSVRVCMLANSIGSFLARARKATCLFNKQLVAERVGPKSFLVRRVA